MLSPVEFVALWGADQLVTSPPRAVDRLPLAAEDKAFLVAAGLPTDAAPFLSFNAPAATELPTVAEQWGVAVDLGRYRVIGSDGSGNPIVFDERSGGQVLRLDHENGFASALINSTVRQLAESLFAYRKLVKATQAEFGPDAS